MWHSLRSATKKCAWWESNPRQTRFRKPPLYPTELQTHVYIIILQMAPLRQPARLVLRQADTVDSAPSG